MKQHTDIELQELATKLWHREKPLCQTLMVWSMQRCADQGRLDEQENNAFSSDAIENLYPNPSDWSIEQCREWLENNTDLTLSGAFAETRPWRELVQYNAEPAEILEWWAVSDWFADKLRAKGECVLSNDYGTWWGRQCSGQSVVLDGVIQQIAVEVLV